MPDFSLSFLTDITSSVTYNSLLGVDWIDLHTVSKLMDIPSYAFSVAIFCILLFGVLAYMLDRNGLYVVGAAGAVLVALFFFSSHLDRIESERAISSQSNIPAPNGGPRVASLEVVEKAKPLPGVMKSNYEIVVDSRTGTKYVRVLDGYKRVLAIVPYKEDGSGKPILPKIPF